MSSPSFLRKALTVVAVSAAALLTGCGASSTAAPADNGTASATLAIIAGNRQGDPTIFSTTSVNGQDEQVLNLTSLGKSLHDKLSSSLTVTVIPADGDPTASQSANLPVNDKNPKTRTDSIDSNVSSAAGLIAASQAKVSESNTLAAMDTAARASKSVYVIDSGVSTTGPVMFQAGLLSPKTDMNLLVRQLKASGNQPDFSGVHFTWWGLGQVAAPQPALPIWARAQLQKFWEAVITAGGGTVEFNNEPFPPGSEAPNGLPAVTPVNFTDTAVAPIALSLPDTQLQFNQNEATFAEKDKTRTLLAAIAPDLNKNDHPDIWLTGCTALDPKATEASMKTLSQARAQAVATLLHELGVSSNLHTDGYGPNCPGRIPDLDANGQLIEAKATANRKVLITSLPQHQTPAQ